MRGIDPEGNVANNVETEQILIIWEDDGKPKDIFSFVEVRGSIPVFWQQKANLKYKPRPTLVGDEKSSVIHPNYSIISIGRGIQTTL